MPGNTFGYLFRVTSFGESHGRAVGGIIDGCPAGLTIDFGYIRQELSRRRFDFPGTTQRREEDAIEWHSGIVDDKTIGTPISFLVRNSAADPSGYDELKEYYRPSHADYTYEKKYGIRDYRGGGRASGRETIVRVIAGAIAKLYLRQFNIQVYAGISQIGPVILSGELRPEAASSSFLQLTEPEREGEIISLIEKAKETGDTLGGTVVCRITGTPPGLGEPVFDKLQADLARAMLGIGTAKAFEYGLGFRSAELKGSAYNDRMEPGKGGMIFLTNHDGGIQGGISNGQDITFRVGFKPVPSIHISQPMAGRQGKLKDIKIEGKHDTCHIPRLVVIVEAMAALVMADHHLRNLGSGIKI